MKARKQDPTKNYGPKLRPNIKRKQKNQNYKENTVTRKSRREAPYLARRSASKLAL